MKRNNIPVELDDRISDIADIKTVITADENDVGKMGYFANSIHRSRKTIEGYEYGKINVSLATFLKICKTHDVEVIIRKK